MQDETHAHFVMDDFHAQVIRESAERWWDGIYTICEHDVTINEVLSLGKEAIVSAKLIDAYLALVSHSFDTPRVEVVESEFANLLKDMDYEQAIRKFYLPEGKSVIVANIDQLDLIFVPAQLVGEHWSVLVIDLKRKRFHHFDSTRTQEGSRLAFETGRKLLQKEEKVRKRDLELSSWKERDDVLLPELTNAWDSGIFAAQAIRYLLQSNRLPSRMSQEDWPFEQEAADAIRWHMWKEITAGVTAPLEIKTIFTIW
ncbi:Peptidase C48, SUMO/Sentrin/Ubl1 [Kalmanozyma brasiliensis GHG001]|uniref:Peptidase C48, SUMO/Sentrin/Ubl1 n=1 Tax=Kalmanozyma brasiliensis (strain GHG001) TaxID=1365824 RepID=UPI002867D6E6|nr:Peptidase C48, SUMO/Sentrin/Ubl1 [Kalmanozyma brasiliensis GHG001]KAF6766829.1 Peptidase C48, SUMO/Sentrin/Ubl1 [Kalmanozyma brasiliensis GHG001]